MRSPTMPTAFSEPLVHAMPASENQIRPLDHYEPLDVAERKSKLKHSCRQRESELIIHISELGGSEQLVNCHLRTEQLVDPRNPIAQGQPQNRGPRSAEAARRGRIQRDSC